MTATKLSEALTPMQKLLDQIIEWLPRAAMVLVVLLTGLVLSLLLRRLVRWATARSGLEKVSERVGVAKLLYAIGYRHGLARLLGGLFFLAGMLFTLATVLEMTGLPGVADGVAAVVAFLPRLVAATLVLLGGLMLAGLAQRLMTNVGRERKDLEEPGLISRLVYYAIVVLTVTMAVQQIGLDTWLVNAMLVISLASVLVSVGLAFALGSKAACQNLIARHYYERLARPGDRIRTGDTEGVIVRYGPVSVIVATKAGEVIIPCQQLLAQAVHVDRIDARGPGDDGPEQAGGPEKSDDESRD